MLKISWILLAGCRSVGDRFSRRWEKEQFRMWEDSRERDEHEKSCRVWGRSNSWCRRGGRIFLFTSQSEETKRNEMKKRPFNQIKTQSKPNKRITNLEFLIDISGDWNGECICCQGSGHRRLIPIWGGTWLCLVVRNTGCGWANKATWRRDVRWPASRDYSRCVFIAFVTELGGQWFWTYWRLSESVRTEKDSIYEWNGGFYCYKMKWRVLVKNKAHEMK